MNKLLNIGLLILIGSTGFAQKLPKTQQGGYHAPAGVRVDGKIAEWGDLKAYNNTTQIYYTIANNSENLYLVVKASSPDIIYKIVKGGITLTINTQAKKKQSTNAAITFPMFEENGSKMFTTFDNKPESTGDSAKDRQALDSLAAVKNKVLGTYLKWIGTLNIQGITDSLISTYNTDGIKVSYAIDGNICYNYELAVPLKSLGLFAVTNKFFYNIQLNGEAFYFDVVREIRPGRFVLLKNSRNNNSSDGSPTSTNTSVSSNATTIYATDFWGEYTMIK